MDRRSVLLGCFVGLATPRLAVAQPAKKTARVGWLGFVADTSPDASVPLAALRSGLKDRGWVEGDNLAVEVRVGDRSEAAALAVELVRANVDVIVAQGPMSIYARDHTGAIPLVFILGADPVEAGLVASLARPGGNLTGITGFANELAVKRVELLKSAHPAITRLAALANDRHPGFRIEQAVSQEAAERLGLNLNLYPVRSPQDFDAAFAAIARDDMPALVAYPDGLINLHRKVIADFTTRQRVSSISGWSEFAHAGNLMSYGPVHRDFNRQLASFVDRLLRGAKPADLPVERPTRFELVINLKAAERIELPVPQSLLLRADEVIR
jgi:putative tryptophan/tyrosine transport system substrate-binding protein